MSEPISGGGTGKVVVDLHSDLKKWQKSNEKSACRIFWASIVMIILAAVQIYLAF